LLELLVRLDIKARKSQSGTQLLGRLAGSSEHVTRSHGLTTERYQMLLLIKVAEQRSEKITVSDLANALNVVNSSATQLVRRAENLRLLKREVSERDARIRYLRLTDEGERRLRAAVAELSENRSRLLNFLKPLRQ